MTNYLFNFHRPYADHHIPLNMSLTNFKKLLLENFSIDSMTPEQLKIVKFLDQQIIENKKKYKSDKDNGKFNFGKYSGWNVKQILQDPSGKGENYIKWIYIQPWFSESKYPELYEQIKTEGIKKKV